MIGNIRLQINQSRTCIAVLLLSAVCRLYGQEEGPIAGRSFQHCDEAKAVTDSLLEDGLDDTKNFLLAESLFQYASENNCPVLPQTLNLLGLQYYCKNDLVNAKRMLLLAEPLLSIPTTEYDYSGRNQRFLGLVYLLEERFENAILYFNRSKEIYEAHADSLGIADALQNLGLSYLEMNNVTAAEQHLLKAQRIINRFPDDHVLGYLNQHLARVYLRQGDFTKAIQYISEADTIWKQMDYAKGFFHTSEIRALIYDSLDNREKQIEALIQSIEFGKKAGLNVPKNASHFRIGKFYQERGELDKARINFEIAIHNGQNLTKEELEISVASLTHTYVLENDLPALQKLYRTLLDIREYSEELKDLESLKWLKNEVTLADQIQYTEALQLTNNKSARKIQSQFRLLLLLFIFAGLVLTIAYLLYRQAIVRKNLNQKLAAQNQSLANFAYIASHDLKAPARNIVNFSGLLKRKLSNVQNREEVLELVDVIEKGGQNMFDLVTDLLQFSQLENDEHQFTTITPHELIREILREIDGTIRESAAVIRIGELPEQVVADRQKMRQLLLNLITNSLKFHQEGVNPKIDITGETTAEWHIFRVQDQGIGIEKQYQEKIFNMFQKLNSGGKYEGTGIGLAICKKVTEIHGGDIWLDSIPGSGSTFSFSISRKLSHNPAPVQQPAAVS